MRKGRLAGGARMLRIIPALAARTQFGQILARVRKNGERFVVDKRGAPQAVILSVEDYLRTFALRPDALARIQRAAVNRRLNLLPLRAINLEIKRYRRSRASQAND